MPAVDETIERQRADLEAVSRLVEASRSVVVCAHTSPDGDALGSTLALVELIERAWPGREVTALLADSDVVPRIYRFLPGAERLVPASAYEGDPDLFVCVDLSQPGRLNEARAVLERSRRVAVVDHHPAPSRFWDAGVVRPDAAATGVIIAEYARMVMGAVTPTMAQCLLCALMTDTGRFQYQNANGEAFEVASMLVDAGASPSDVALHVYQSDRLSYLRLCAVVMGRIATFEHGKIAYSYATTADLDSCGVPVAECDGLVDIVRRVDGCEVALFLKEVPGGKVRGNLRAKSDRDISSIAREMGGGGHQAAAGFTVDGDVDQALSEVLPKLRALYVDTGGAR